MILDNPEQWDHEALTEVLSYRPVPKQAWEELNVNAPDLSDPQWGDSFGVSIELLDEAGVRVRHLE
jgi:hypothetical protein